MVSRRIQPTFNPSAFRAARAIYTGKLKFNSQDVLPQFRKNGWLNPVFDHEKYTSISGYLHRIALMEHRLRNIIKEKNFVFENGRLVNPIIAKERKLEALLKRQDASRYWKRTKLCELPVSPVLRFNIVPPNVPEPLVIVSPRKEKPFVPLQLRTAFVEKQLKEMPKLVDNYRKARMAKREAIRASRLPY